MLASIVLQLLNIVNPDQEQKFEVGFADLHVPMVLLCPETHKFDTARSGASGV